MAPCTLLEVVREQFIVLLAALAVLMAPLWCACPLMATPAERHAVTSCCDQAPEHPAPEHPAPAEHGREAPDCSHCTDSLTAVVDHPAAVPSALQPLAHALPVAIGVFVAASAPGIELGVARSPPVSGPGIPIRCCALLN
jgi:hypothetical protein